MVHNVAPVIAAERLLHHGLADDVIAAYLARTWSLTAIEQRDAIAAAHILVRRESRSDAWYVSGSRPRVQSRSHTRT